VLVVEQWDSVAVVLLILFAAREFTRIHTYTHTQQAEQEVLSRRAAARKHNHIPDKSSPSSKKAKGKSSKATLASALASSVDGPENQPSTLNSPGFPPAPLLQPLSHLLSPAPPLPTVHGDSDSKMGVESVKLACRVLDMSITALGSQILFASNLSRCPALVAYGACPPPSPPSSLSPPHAHRSHTLHQQLGQRRREGHRRVLPQSCTMLLPPPPRISVQVQQCHPLDGDAGWFHEQRRRCCLIANDGNPETRGSSIEHHSALSHVDCLPPWSLRVFLLSRLRCPPHFVFRLSECCLLVLNSGTTAQPGPDSIRRSGRL
jgi:hypothetical protein